VINSIKKNLLNIISFFLVFFFLILCIFYYNSNTFIKNTDKKRESYLIYLNSYVEKLDKISTSSDFKKRIDNEEFFKKIYKQKQYWELIK
jgi:cell division protein YceG involved in septum cleavage